MLILLHINFFFLNVFKDGLMKPFQILIKSAIPYIMLLAMYVTNMTLN